MSAIAHTESVTFVRHEGQVSESSEEQKIFMKEVGKFMTSNKNEFRNFVEANKATIVSAMNVHKKHKHEENFRRFAKLLVKRNAPPARSYKKQSAALKSIPSEHRKVFIKFVGGLFKSHAKKVANGDNQEKNDGIDKKKPSSGRSYKKQSAAVKSIPIEIRKAFIKSVGGLFKSHVKKAVKEGSDDCAKKTKKRKVQKPETTIEKIARIEDQQAKLAAKQAKLDATKQALMNNPADDEAKRVAKQSKLDTKKAEKKVVAAKEVKDHENKLILEEESRHAEEDMKALQEEEDKKAKADRKAAKKASKKEKNANEMSEVGSKRKE